MAEGSEKSNVVTERKTSHFKEILKPSTTQRDIYIKYDGDSELNPEADNIAQFTSGAQPLVRVGDSLIMSDKISYLSIEIGSSFLPRISITFEDEDYKFRRVMTSKLDFITVYIGNTKDPYFTKQEFVLSGLSAYPESSEVSVSGFLYIPELYQIQTRWFGPDNDKDTVWKIAKFLCEECHLGFWTNIDDTNDSQVWIQDNCTTLDFFEKLQRHAFTSEDTRLLFFIDQYDYLNLIDLSKAYGNREVEYTAYHPYMHTPLQEERAIILSTERTGAKEEDKDLNPFQIKNWTQNIHYGDNAESLPHAIQRNEMMLSALPFEVRTGELQTNTDLIDHKWYIQPKWSDTHDNYNSVARESAWIDMHYQQGDELYVEMSFANMFLYPYQYVPVEIWIEHSRPDLQDITQPSTLDEESALYTDDPEVAELAETMVKKAEVLDKLHSGDYIITSIRYEYRPADDNVCFQFLRLSRLILEDIPRQIKM